MTSYRNRPGRNCLLLWQTSLQRSSMCGSVDSLFDPELAGGPRLDQPLKMGAPGLDFQTWIPSIPDRPKNWESAGGPRLDQPLKMGAPGLDFQTWDSVNTRPAKELGIAAPMSQNRDMGHPAPTAIRQQRTSSRSWRISRRLKERSWKWCRGCRNCCCPFPFLFSTERMGLLRQPEIQPRRIGGDWPTSQY